MKIGIYCYLIADILAKGFQKCLLSCPLPNIYIFFPNRSFSLVLMATESLNLLKYLKKINSSEAIRAIKLKLFRNVHSISLFLLPVLMHFGFYGKTYNGEKWKLALIAVSLQVF